MVPPERVWSGASKDGYAHDKDLKRSDKGPGKGVDLRYVDWDKMKAGQKGKNGNAESGDNGEENGNGEQEDENGQKNGEDEQDDGGGGWDRLWNAPKLG